jgi:outer membrane protein assembly factor BamB
VIGALALGVVSAAAAAGVGDGLLPDDPDPEVALPAPQDLGVGGQLSAEQQEALDRFDPDRPRCQPRGCERWHLPLDEESGPVAANDGWLAVLDGSTVRVRPLDDVGGATESGGGNDARDDGDGRIIEHDVGWLQTRPIDGDAAGSARRIAVTGQGTALLLWPDLLVAIDREGRERLSIPSSDSDAWFLEARDDHVVVIGDLPPGAAPEGTDRLRVTGIDLATGQRLWQRDDIVPRDFVAAGLAGTTGGGTVVMVDTRNGSTLWTRDTGPDNTVQVTTGPWVIDGGRERNEDAELLDAATGEAVATRPESSLLTPIQPLGELWVATWVDDRTRGGRGPRATLVALDDAGQERWQVPLNSLLRGACCPAAIPWRDGTVAIFDPGPSDGRWFVIDARTGARRDLPEHDAPELPGGAYLGRAYVPADAPGRLLQESFGRVAILTADGASSLVSDDEFEVVSADPLVVRQGRHLLRVDPVPGP